MAVGNVGSSSFEFYEGLRVLVPGGTAVALYAGIASTFGSRAADDALAAVVVALLAGFFLLFLDIPGRAAVASFEAPVAFMASWPGLRPHGEASYLNVYYEVLDEKVPQRIRNRTYYQGVIYRIGFESVYFAASSVAVVLIMTVFPSIGTNRQTTGETTLRTLFCAAIAAHAVVVARAFWNRYDEHRRKKGAAERSRRENWKNVFGDLGREIPDPDRVVLTIALVSLGLNIVLGWRVAGVCAVSVALSLWATRYFLGVRVSRGPALDTEQRPDGARRLQWWVADRIARMNRYFEQGLGRPRRQNLHAVSAAAVFGFAAISVCVIGAVNTPRNGPLDPSNGIGWLSLSVVAAILIAARGHERKLTGSYGTLRTWLERNREKLVEDGYFEREPFDGSAPVQAKS